jgi:hypothetical protein
MRRSRSLCAEAGWRAATAKAAVTMRVLRRLPGIERRRISISIFAAAEGGGAAIPNASVVPTASHKELRVEVRTSLVRRSKQATANPSTWHDNRAAPPGVNDIMR